MKDKLKKNSHPEAELLREKLLNGYSQILNNLIQNISFIKTAQSKLEKLEIDQIDLDILMRAGVRRLYDLILRDTFMNLYLIVEDKKGFTYRNIIDFYEFNQKFYPLYSSTKLNIVEKRKIISRLYESLKVNKIRNNFIGHYNMDIDAIEFSFQELYRIVDELEHQYKYFYACTGAQVGIPLRDTLNSLVWGPK